MGCISQILRERSEDREKAITTEGGASLVLTLYCVLCSGCSVLRDKPAKEDLSLALAGMAGSDEVVFEGANMLTRGGRQFPNPYCSMEVQWRIIKGKTVHTPSR